MVDATIIDVLDVTVSVVVVDESVVTPEVVVGADDTRIVDGVSPAAGTSVIAVRTATVIMPRSTGRLVWSS
jgi:hypothetical protein